MPFVPYDLAPALRVLIVDSHDDSALMYAEGLLASGVIPLTAAAPGEALALARAEHPDAIVCNVRLRFALDGLTVIKDLRADPSFAKVPVLALAGYDSPEYRRLASEAGAAVFLLKPVSPDRLRLEILATLQNLSPARFLPNYYRHSA